MRRIGSVLLFGALGLGCVLGDPPAPGAALAELKLPACEGRAWSAAREFQPLLEAENWSGLEAMLGEYHTDYLANPACERRMAYAFEHGFRWSSLERTPWDPWIEARPESWIALTVRGSAWVRDGFNRRGANFAVDTREDQWRGMHEAHARAREDLMRAIELQPDNPVAWYGLLGVVRTHGTTPRRLAIYRHAIAQSALSERVRLEAIWTFDPKWGGDMTQVDAIVAEALSRTHENPRLARLTGEAALMRAQRFHRRLEDPPGLDGKLSGPLAYLLIGYYDHALRWAEPASGWHAQRIRAREQLGLYDAAAADAKLATDHKPAAVYQWVARVKSLRKAGREEEAVEVALEGIGAIPDLPQIHAELGRTLEALDRRVAAAEAYHAAYSQSTTDSWKAWSLRREGKMWSDEHQFRRAERALEKSLHLEPEDVDTLVYLGNVLAQWGRPGAQPLLVRYLELSDGVDHESERRASIQNWLDENPAPRS